MHSLIELLLNTCVSEHHHALKYEISPAHGWHLIRGYLEANEITTIPEDFQSIIQEIKVAQLAIPERNAIFNYVIDNREFQHIQENGSSGTKTAAIFSLVDRCIDEISTPIILPVEN